MAMRKEEKETDDDPRMVGFPSKHQQTLDLYRQHRMEHDFDDEFDAMVRETNEEIESED